MKTRAAADLNYIVYVHIFPHTDALFCMSADVCVCVYEDVYICIRTCVYIYVWINVYIHTHDSSCRNFVSSRALSYLTPRRGKMPGLTFSNELLAFIGVQGGSKIVAKMICDTSWTFKVRSLLSRMLSV